MQKQLVIMGIIALLFCVGLSGCNENSNTLNPEKNKFVGTWKTVKYQNPFTIDLFSDGTCSYTGFPGKWDLKDGKLVLATSQDIDITYTYNYVFSNNDRTLSLTDTAGGNPDVYTKQ